MNEENYKIYITDALKVISDNISHIFGGNSLSRRYIDFISLQEEIPEESAEEIIDRMKNKLARFGGEE